MTNFKDWSLELAKHGIEEKCHRRAEEVKERKGEGWTNTLLVFGLLMEFVDNNKHIFIIKKCQKHLHMDVFGLFQYIQDALNNILDLISLQEPESR